MTQQLCLTVVRSDESENFTKATQLSLLSSLKPLVFKCSELLERSGALLLHPSAALSGDNPCRYDPYRGN